jgi:hypothetical protein
MGLAGMTNPELTLCLIFVALLASMTVVQADMRLLPYTDDLAYALRLRSPWDGGGEVIINFPEHLERWPDTAGILRHNDPEPAGRWVLAEDGLSAVLDVDSRTMPGVHVRAEAKVCSPRRLAMSLRIDNHSPKDMAGIIPLYCVQYGHLRGFAPEERRLQHTYVEVDGRLVSLAELPTSDPEAAAKGAYVRGCEQRDSDEFLKENGGLIPQLVDSPVIAVTALDGDRKLLVSWTPGKKILANALIPCLHADPYYGEIASGASVERRGHLIFTELGLQEAFEEASAPPPAKAVE